VLAALEAWFEERDPAVERGRWDADCAVIAARVAQIPGAVGEVIEPAGIDRVPRLKITWDREKYPLDGLALRQRVLDGEPRVMLDDNSATENSIAVDPFQLQPGDAEQVGDAVVAALLVSAQAERVPASAPALMLSGTWELRVDLLHGTRIHRLRLNQTGAALSGQQQSAQFDSPITGALDGDVVRFTFGTRYEAATISFRFEGKAEAGAMSGTVELGAGSDQNSGIVNRTQFGAGEWRAQRVA